MLKLLKRMLITFLVIALGASIWVMVAWAIGYLVDRVFGLVYDKYIAFGSAMLALGLAIACLVIVAAVTFMNHLRGALGAATKRTTP